MMSAATTGVAGRRGRNRLMLLLSFAALMPLAAFAGFAAMKAVDAQQRQHELRLQHTAGALAAGADALLGSLIAALRTLASSEMLSGPLDPDAFAARTRAVGELFDGWIVLLEGQPGYRPLSMSTIEDQTMLPEALSPETQAALAAALARVFDEEQPAVSDLFVGQVLPRQIITVIVPVLRPGEPRRALALSVEPSLFLAMLQRQDLGPTTFAAIVDRHLRVVAHTRDTDGTHVGRSAPNWIGPAAARREPAIVTGRGWSGDHNVYAIEPLEIAPAWTVVVGEPVWHQRTATSDELLWLLAGAAALLAGLAVAAWTSRRTASAAAQREAAAIQEGRAQVERLLEHLPAVVFLREIAPDGSIRHTYRRGDFETVFGLPRAETATRTTFRDLAHPDDPSLTSEMPRLLRDGRTSYQWRIRQPSGTWRPVHSFVRVLGRKGDGTIEIVGYTVDISARQEAEARAQAAARLASLGEMAAGLAHELRQPLQTISLAADVGLIGLDRDDRASSRHALERIIDQVARTADLVERLRRFARGADQATLSPVAIMDAIDGALALTRNTLRDASIVVQVSVPDRTLRVLGQTVLIEQMLVNLLLNARDALTARPPGAERRISIAAGAVAPDAVALTVRDTGGGIAPEVMARLFQPFVTTKGAEKGTGLGLSICHGLVTAMQGTIEGRNDADGAVFMITLKRAGAEVPTPTAA